MRLLRKYLRRDVPRLVENGVRLKVIGRRDRLPDGLADEIAAAEARDRRATVRLDLHRRARLLGARRDRECRGASGSAITRRERPVFTRLLARLGHGSGRDVDLLIRTGGEQRLSDFLLWECAYAELLFTETMWPDFGAEHLRDCARRLSRTRAPLRWPFGRGRVI